MINITVVITSEICTDGKYNHFLLLEKLKKPVSSCTCNLDIAGKAMGDFLRQMIEMFTCSLRRLLLINLAMKECS